MVSNTISTDLMHGDEIQKQNLDGELVPTIRRPRRIYRTSYDEVMAQLQQDSLTKKLRECEPYDICKNLLSRPQNILKNLIG